MNELRSMLWCFMQNCRLRWREWRHKPSLVEVINLEFERRK